MLDGIMNIASAKKEVPAVFGMCRNLSQRTATTAAYMSSRGYKPMHRDDRADIGNEEVPQNLLNCRGEEHNLTG